MTVVRDTSFEVAGGAQMEAEADVILTGDAAIEALAKHLYDTQLKSNSGSSVLNFLWLFHN